METDKHTNVLKNKSIYCKKKEKKVLASITWLVFFFLYIFKDFKNKL